MSTPAAEGGPFWASFGRDPRLPDNHGLRASDADRDRIRDAVSAAYADGRLTSDELNARLNQIDQARLLGELLPIVADLLPTAVPDTAAELARTGDADIERRAQAHYADRRRQALFTMAVPTLVCFTIWISSMIFSGTFIFPWPIFVLLGTGGHLSRILAGRESFLDEERAKLQRKQDQRDRRETGDAGEDAGGVSDVPRAIEATGPDPVWRVDQSEPEKQPNRDDLR